MKKRTYLSYLILLILLIVNAQGASASEGSPGLLENKGKAGVLEIKSIDRFSDPILIKGGSLKAFIGSGIDYIRVYACKGKEMVPILFQIDEMTEQGDWVFPEGPKNNADMGNGLLDDRDVLVFMADDSGDRITRDLWPSEPTKGQEVMIIDPLTRKKGWVYIFFFNSDPPPLSNQESYIHYDYATETTTTQYWTSSHLITEDGKHSNFYKNHTISPLAGGNGKNFVDRFKLRIIIKLFFGTASIHLDEENMGADVLAYKRGPVRLIRRMEQWVKMPFNLKALRVFSDLTHYRNLTSAPIMFDIPFRLNNMVSNVYIIAGTDYSPGAKGSHFFNSSNPEGFLINGKMGDVEDNFNPARDEWRVMTGPAGSFLTRSVFSEKIIKGMEITQGIIDDESHLHPPESIPGCIGFAYQKWHVGQLSKGTYKFYLEFYFPPFYKKGDEVAYLNYQDHPLIINTGKTETINLVRIEAIPDRSVFK
ncbi:MAG: hypothetical protein GY864_12245 [Desulfobacterales bacterium]|nr:hypothetical protein [Desulfobacterales bacterium]